MYSFAVLIAVEPVETCVVFLLTNTLKKDKTLFSINIIYYSKVIYTVEESQ